MSVDLNLVNLTKPCFVRIVARFWVPSNGGSAGGGSSNSSTKGGRFGSAVASTKAPGNADNVSKNENEPEHENDDDDDDDENDDDGKSTPPSFSSLKSGCGHRIVVVFVRFSY